MASLRAWAWRINAASGPHGASASPSSGNHATAFEIDPHELGYGRNIFDDHLWKHMGAAPWSSTPELAGGTAAMLAP
jgi:hypothetical protein